MKSVVRKLLAHSAIRFGASVLGVLLAVALLAPWLGTVDPSLFDPASRDLLPGKTGEIVWTFNRPGDFDFACLIAGHYQAGMVGKIKVAASSAKGDGHAHKH